MTHLLASLALSKIALIGLPGLVIATAVAGRIVLGLPRQTLLWAGIVAAFLIWGGMLIRLGAADVQARWDAALAADARRVKEANEAADARYIDMETVRNDADANAARLAAELALSQLDAAAAQPPAGKACPLPASPPDPDSVLRVWRGR